MLSWHLFPMADWPQLRGEWQALQRRVQASALLDADFIEPFLPLPQAQPVIARAVLEGRTVAMTVLTRTSPFSWNTLQPAQAPLGLWLQDPGIAQAHLARALLARLGTPAAVLGLLQRDPLLEARPPDQGRARCVDYIATAHVPLEGSFEDYWAARGKNLRTNLKKQRARLDGANVATRLDLVRDAGQVDAAVRDYGRLESAGWKSAQGTAVQGGTPQGQAYAAMLSAFCARGAGRIYRYWLGEQLAAMDLCIEDGQQLVVLKTSYDESLATQLSPALLMREEIMRSLFAERRFARVEFYGKVMDWHLRWTDQLRTMYHVNYYRWPGLGAMHQWARHARR
jgi:CelD/BcsL family acetyltransferase involved in cellulose biosynthesis